MEYKKFIELTKNRNPWTIVYPRISISSPVYKTKIPAYLNGATEAGWRTGIQRRSFGRKVYMT